MGSLHLLASMRSKGCGANRSPNLLFDRNDIAGAFPSKITFSAFVKFICE